MALFLPSPWTRQPQYPVALQKNGLASGCLGAFLGSTLSFNGKLPSSNTGTKDAGIFGIGASYNGSTATTFPVGTIPAISGPFSIGVLLKIDAFTNYSAIFANQNSPSTNGYEIRGGGGATDSTLSFIMLGSSQFRSWEGSAGTLTTGNRTIVIASDGVLTNAPTFWVDKTQITPTNTGGAGTGTIAASTGGFNIGTRQDAFTHLDGDVYLVAVWDRQLSAREALAFSDNPWQLFAPIRKQIYFGVTAGGTNTTITPTTGSIIVAGSAPTVAQNILRQPTVGSVVVTGNAPTLKTNTIRQPAAGSVIVAGNAPAVVTGGNHVVNPNTGTIVVSGLAPTLKVNTIRQPTVGSVVVAGAAPTVRQGVVRLPTVGSIVVAGLAPTVSYTSHVVRTPSAGTITVAGNAPEIIGASIWTNVSAASTIWTNASAASTTWTNQ